jgi:KDO2-lipid IV(A) lauroyltransferase
MKLLIKLIMVPMGFVFTALPRKLQICAANAMGIFWFDILRLRRDVVLSNLKLAFPEWSEKKRIQVGRKSIQNLCLSFFEYFIIVRFKPEWRDKYFEIEKDKFAPVDQEIQKGHGVFLLSLHLGAIDFALAGYQKFGYNITCTFRRIKNKAFDDFVTGLRQKEGIKTLEDRRNPFDIFRALKNNDCVLFIMDQYMGKPHGINARFFGHPAGTAAGLAAFALKTGQPVYPAYNYRRNGKIVLTAGRPILIDLEGDREQNILKATQKFNDSLEEIIRKHPEQWLWVHKRWKEYV